MFPQFINNLSSFVDITFFVLPTNVPDDIEDIEDVENEIDCANHLADEANPLECYLSQIKVLEVTRLKNSGISKQPVSYPPFDYRTESALTL